MQVNDLDIIILVVVLVSALIAWGRGLVKESLSIVGWVLVTIAVVTLLPILAPIAAKFIESAPFAGAVTAIFILVVFMVGWVLMTEKLVGKIRSSKLKGLDRTLGMFFGVARACLLVILANILVNIMIPQDQQSDIFTKSKFFNLAGKFAKPVEELIPGETLEDLKASAAESGGVEDKTDGKPKEKKLKKKTQIEESLEMFEKLTTLKETKKEEKKPEAKKKDKNKDKGKDNPFAEAYDAKERKELDKLVETVE